MRSGWLAFGIAQSPAAGWLGLVPFPRRLLRIKSSGLGHFYDDVDRHLESPANSCQHSQRDAPVAVLQLAQPLARVFHLPSELRLGQPSRLTYYPNRVPVRARSDRSRAHTF